MHPLAVAPDLYSNFAASVERNPDSIAIGFLREGKRVEWNYRQLSEKIDFLARGLNAIGLKKGDRVAVLAGNHPYWPVADFAISKLGLVLVPIHTTLTVDQIIRILKQSGSKLLIVGGGIESKLPEVLEKIPSGIETLVFFQNPETLKLPALPQKILWLEKMMADFAGAPDPPPVEIAPRDLCTIIFTSGTTGEMKGVKLSHQGIVDNCFHGMDMVGVKQGEIVLSVLPLSHAFERTAGLLSPLYLGTRIEYGRGIFELVGDMGMFKPTRMNAVPRLLEKMREAIEEALKKKSDRLLRVFQWCVRGSAAKQAKLFKGEKPSIKDAFADALGKKLFYGKIKKKFGGQLQGFICGGAPLSEELVKFFQALGIQVLQGYGLTETSPIICATPHDKNKIGSVGPPIANMEIKIGPNREILARGTSLMLGYDDETATREAIDSEGWFHTGDQGEIDEDGFLYVRGRVKELIVTSYGKNIVPSWVEQNLEKSPLIQQSVVFGHGKSYLVALLILNRNAVFEKLPDEKRSLPWEELCRDPVIESWLKEDLKLVQQPLASYEQIKKFTVIPEEFSMSNDLLTPTLKLKRNKILARYETEVTGMF